MLKAIRFKMMSMEFRKPEPEKPIPYDENLLNMLHVEDVKRLKAARSSFKYDLKVLHKAKKMNNMFPRYQPHHLQISVPQHKKILLGFQYLHLKLLSIVI